MVSIIKKNPNGRHMARTRNKGEVSNQRIIEPTIRRVLENKDSVDKINKQQEIITYHLDDLDMNIGK